MLKKKIILLTLIVFVFSCNNTNSSKTDTKKDASLNDKQTIKTEIEEKNASLPESKTGLQHDNNSIKVTFIELGSVKCVPCKMMQPVMEDIEKEYKDQVKVIFYDVWTAEGKPYAQKYKIRVIPTQVFLDAQGNEYFRHEGFFPKEDLIKILKQKGIK